MPNRTMSSEVDPVVLDYRFTQKHLELVRRREKKEPLFLKHCCDILEPLAKETASCFEGVMHLLSNHLQVTPGLNEVRILTPEKSFSARSHLPLLGMSFHCRS